MKISEIVETFAKRTYRSRLSSVGARPGQKSKVYNYEYDNIVVPFQVKQTFDVGGNLGGQKGGGKRSRVSSGSGLANAIVERIMSQLPEVAEHRRYSEESYRAEIAIGRKVVADLKEAGILTDEDIGYMYDEEPDDPNY